MSNPEFRIRETRNTWGKVYFFAEVKTGRWIFSKWTGITMEPHNEDG